MEEVGGPHMIELLYKHHVEGESLRRLAALEELAVGTLRGRLSKARSVLDRVNLWPESWQRAAVSRGTEQLGALDESLDSERVVTMQSRSGMASAAAGSDQLSIFEQWLRAVDLAR